MKDDENKQEYFSVREVARKLGMTVGYIYRLANTGELRAARFGKLYRFSAKDIEDFIRMGYEKMGEKT